MAGYFVFGYKLEDGVKRRCYTGANLSPDELTAVVLASVDRYDYLAVFRDPEDDVPGIRVQHDEERRAHAEATGGLYIPTVMYRLTGSYTYTEEGEE